MAEEEMEYDFTGLFEDDCGYFEGRKNHEELYILSESDEEAARVIGECANPRLVLYDFFLSEGFRRSGIFVYRATCPDCRKCVPIRIEPKDFVFNKKHRHILKKNSDIEMTISTEPKDLVTDEKVLLMREYNKRHNPEKNESFEEVKNTLLFMNGLKESSYSDELFSEPYYPGVINMDYRLNGKLVGVGIIDLGMESLSSNYFYYDISDEIMKRSIGTFTILKEIEFCKITGIPYYYLGYYLSECNKMNYKGKFLPHQLLINGEWVEQKVQNFDV